MPSMREFYDRYWAWREQEYMYDPERPPKRVVIAANLLNLSDAAEVLDIGCGEGLTAKVLRERFGSGVKLTGIDISQRAAELAKDRYDEGHVLDISDEDPAELLGSVRFDAITCLEVIEHLFNPKAALAKMHALLKPGGSLIISFPNFAHYRDRLKCLLGRFPTERHIFDSVEHLHYFTVESFRELLDACGFRIEKIDGNFSVPFPLKLLPKAAKRGIGLAWPSLMGKQIVVKAVKI